MRWRVEIRPHGKSHREDHYEQENTTIPGEEAFKIAESLRAALRGEPVFLVWVNISLASGLVAILRDTQNSTSRAGRSVTAKVMKNWGLVIQPFGIPEAPKCEAIRSGSSGKSWRHCAIAANAMAKKDLGIRVPCILSLSKKITGQNGLAQ